MGKQRYEPSPERVVLRKLEQEKTSGGIIIPETVRQDQTFGEVMAVGSRVDWLRPGQIVQVPNNQRAAPLTLNGEKAFVLDAVDVLGIVHVEEQEP